MSIINTALIGKLQLDVNKKIEFGDGKRNQSIYSNENGEGRYHPISLAPNTVSEDCTINADANAVSAGPIVIEDGITVTIEDGATWVIV